MIIHRTPSHRRIPTRLALVLAVALSFVAAPAVSQVEDVQAPSAVIITEGAPATPVDHAINTKGAGGDGRAAPVDHAINTKGSGAADRAAAGSAAPAEPVDHSINTKGSGAANRAAAGSAAPAEPVATDHAIHAACVKAADKIACNRWEDYKLTHKDD
jgi:hypothetical protein